MKNSYVKCVLHGEADFCFGASVFTCIRMAIHHSFKFKTLYVPFFE